MRAIAGIWRWRHNPLCRRTDLLEAWTALVTALLIAVAAPVVGVLTGVYSERVLLASVQQQHRERHQVTATVLRTIRQPPADSDPETVSARAAHGQVLARWRAPDGTKHRGTVTTGMQALRPGERFPLWTTAHGTVVPPPMEPVAASTHATLAGIGAGALLAGCLDGVRRLVMWRIVRRRLAWWERAWERAGPDWGRTGTGS